MFAVPEDLQDHAAHLNGASAKAHKTDLTQHKKHE